MISIKAKSPPPVDPETPEEKARREQAEELADNENRLLASKTLRSKLRNFRSLYGSRPGATSVASVAAALGSSGGSGSAGGSSSGAYSGGGFGGGGGGGTGGPGVSRK